MKTTRRLRVVLLALALTPMQLVVARYVQAQAIVPGTGQRAAQVGDDFEDETWEYTFQLPKSTQNLNEQTRMPTGRSTNGRWYEGAKRGQPDVIKRVETPEGGLPGSRGSLLLRSLQTGIPGAPSHRLQQDDFIANIDYQLKGALPVWQSPSAVVRVFLPPVDEWEKRTGPHFAFRVAVTKNSYGSRSSSAEEDTYWPGMFIEFESKSSHQKQDDFAWIRVRSDQRGMDFKGKQITQTGWWTLGISCSPDGQVHYYAKPGVEDLTEEDHIASQFPYGYRAKHFKTFFFNVCNGDDGRTWSTNWIIDDPMLYFISKARE